MSITRFTRNPVAEMISWLESEPVFTDSASRLAPYLRVEDFLDEGDYVIRAEMPGIDPEKDVEVIVEEDILTIRGERREEKKERNHQEFRYGPFARSVRLPAGAKSEEISASYADGVLELRVPLGEPQAETRTIPVQRGKG